MLFLLQIENIAVIERADIRFSPGFNVLTGETGAGKSIVMDAIGALSGARVSHDLIRTGASSAAVTGQFADLPADIQPILAELGVLPEEDGVLTLSRRFTGDGRNVCLINTQAVPLSALRRLAPFCCAHFGQHDSRTLLDVRSHIRLLDRFAETESALQAYRDAYAALRALRDAQRAAIEEREEALRRRDLLAFTCNEIESSALSPGEDDALKTQIAQYKQAETAVDALDEAQLLLFGGEQPGALSALDGAVRALQSLRGVEDDALRAATAALADAALSARAAADTVQTARAAYDFSEQTLDEMAARAAHLNHLKRKYGGTLDAVIAAGQAARTALDRLDSADERIETLRAQYAEQYAHTEACARALSARRRAAGAALSARVNAELAYLMMPGAVFSVRMEEKQRDGRLLFGADGIDNVEFDLAANVGEAARSLAKTASGGELSRLMLALNTVQLSGDAGTLIFDEVDAGIGGVAATRAANRLYALSRRCQVLCVTHLSQLAVLADTHFFIEKSEVSGRTVTAVSALDFDARVREIARINGGEHVTPATLAAAADQLRAAKAEADTDTGMQSAAETETATAETETNA